jgi:hypothetical protein
MSLSQYISRVVSILNCRARVTKKPMTNVTKIDVTFDDGSVQTVVAAPVVALEDTEVNVVLSDGSIKKFIPA